MLIISTISLVYSTPEYCLDEQTEKTLRDFNSQNPNNVPRRSNIHDLLNPEEVGNNPHPKRSNIHDLLNPDEAVSNPAEDTDSEYTDSEYTLESEDTLKWGDPNQPVANKKNGPMHIEDPENQLVDGFSRRQSNQPFAKHLAAAMKHRYTQTKVSHMSKHSLDERQWRFVKGFLHREDRQLHDTVFPRRWLGRARPRYHKFPNTKKIREMLRDLF